MQTMDRVFEKLPKIELHAHLSGSVSRSTLCSLLNEERGVDRSASLPVIENDDMGSLARCFQLFQVLHSVITTVEIVERVTIEVIEEFAEDGVIYLELRTTLRPLPTLHAYLEAVMRGLMTAPSVVDGKLDARLLLSIDRARGLDDARATVDLLFESVQHWPNFILGVELSGNPAANSLVDFGDLLNKVKEQNLHTSVHFAELPGRDEEWLTFLERHVPDRIGHAVFLPLPGCVKNSSISAAALQASALVQKHRIPIEICLTSNVKVGTVPDYEVHHVRSWIDSGHPVCICTDDKGLFSCSASGELQMLVDRCGIPLKYLSQILVDSAQAAFCPESKKAQLIERITSFFVQHPTLLTEKHVPPENLLPNSQ
ncbi:Adenosine deaminase [Paragonimus heterotremus]|uniref:Adenosine deaminase n=1 Tax=Paragonimus heterotremus TaxID=100268 RepID=A0A8J4SPJ9_9TREM|nr:Adenosine deaminase [Paragonimus heterotremus]